MIEWIVIELSWIELNSEIPVSLNWIEWNGIELTWIYWIDSVVSFNYFIDWVNWTVKSSVVSLLILIELN